MKRKSLKFLLVFLILTAIAVSAVLTACNGEGGSEEKTFKITFMDGDRVVYTRDVGVNTAVLYKPDPEPGKVFVDWYTDKELTEPFDGSHGITSDMTVYGKWLISEFTVTFLDYEGKVIESQTVAYGGDATPPDADDIPVPEGYVFDGWSGSYENVTDDIELTAEYTKVNYVGKIDFIVNGESVFAAENVEEGQSLAKYINQANTLVSLPDYIQFNSEWADADGNVVSGSSEFGDEDMVLYARLSLAESLDLSKYDGYSEGISSGAEGFDAAAEYGGDVTTSLGYALSGTAYKDVEYSFAWYFNEGEEAIADFSDVQNQNRYWEKHLFDFGGSDRLSFTNVGEPGVNAGRLQIIESWGFPVGEYYGLYKLVMTVTPKEETGFGDLGTYTREIEWNFKIMPKDFTVKYNNVLESVEYDGEAHAVNASTVFPKNALGSGDVAAFSFDGENYSETLEMTDAGSYKIYFKVSRENYIDYIKTVSFEISKKPITVYAVKPENREFYYGEVPSYDGFGYRAEGLAAGDELDISDAVFKGLPQSFGSAGMQYTVYIDGGIDNGNYDISYAVTADAAGSNVVTVQKRPVYITVEAASAVYGSGLPDFDVAVADVPGNMGFAPGESFDNLIDPGAYTVYGWKVSGRNNVGIYDVVPDYSNYNSGNYDIRPVPGTLTVFPANLIGYVSSEETQYRTEFRGKFTVTFPSLVGNVDENAYVLSQYEFTFKTEGYYTSAPAGEVFPVKGSAVAKNPDKANYIIELKDGDLTVVKALINVEVTPKPGVEGDFTFGTDSSEVLSAYDISANWPVGDSHFDALEPTTNYEGGMDVGNYFVTARVKADAVDAGVYDNYRLTFVKKPFNLKQRVVKVTLRYGTIYYGDEFSDSYYLSEGSMVYGDKLEVSFPTDSNDYVAGSAVGDYPVTPVFKVNGSENYGNYDISLTNPVLTVQQRPVTLSLLETARLNAGESWEGRITEADNLYKDDYVVVGLTLDTNASGSHKYVPGSEGWTVTAEFKRRNVGSDVSGNYKIDYDITVTILSVFIAHTLKPDFADAADGIFDFETVYDNAAHKITVSVADGIKDDYTVSYYTGDDPENGIYTEEAPEFTHSGTYIVHYKLSPTSVDGEEERGTYTLTISKRKLTVTPSEQEIGYGEEFVYQGEIDISGLAKGDEFTPDIRAEGYSVGNAVGDYPLYIYFEDGADAMSDYDIKLTGAILRVIPRQVSIYVPAVKVAYGENAVLTYEIKSGSLYDGDATIYLYSDYSAGSDVGEYDIKFRDDVNYQIVKTTDSDARVIVSPKKLSVVIDDKKIKYGDGIPEFTYTVTGMYPGDEQLLQAKCAYVPGKSGKGKYPIILDPEKLANYDASGAAGTLTVQPKDVSILWDLVESAFTYNGEVQSVIVTAKNISDPYDGETVAGVDPSLITLTYYKDGAETKFLNAGTYTVKVDLGANFKIWNPEYTFVMDKAVYDADRPDAIDIAYRHDRSLADIAAPENLSWVNPNEVPVPGKTSYAAKVTNENFYAAEEISVTINVSKAAVRPVSVYTLDFVAGKTAVLPEQIPAVYAVYVEGSAVEIPPGTLAFSYGTDSFDKPGSYKTTVSLSDEGSEYYMMTEKVEVYVKVAAVTLKGVKYTIEDALYNSKSGDTITLTDKVDITFTSGAIAEKLYNDRDYYTVKPGVTLILPSTADTAGIGGTTYMNRTETRYVDEIDSYINMKLTVPEGISLTVRGNVLVRGGLGSTSVGTNGHTSDNHSQIINDGVIIVNSDGLIDLKGFIKGAGTLQMNDGSQLYAPFVVLDYRGGTNTVLAYRKGKIAPFRIYDMPNTQCKVVYEYGSVLKAYFDLYANSAHNNMDDPVTIIGPGSGAIFNMSSGARIIYETYDDGYDLPVLKSSGASNGYATTDKHSVTLLGNITLGSLKLEIKLLIISATVDMNEVFFPVSYLYDIIVGDGKKETVLTADAIYKFMPGATLTVKKNATVNIGGQLIFYEEGYEDDMTGFNGASDSSKVAAYYRYPVLLSSYPAVLNIDGGTLNVTGTLAAAVNATDGGRLIMASGAGTSITTQEGHSGESSSTSALWNTGTMTLHDVSVTSTLSDGTAVSAGKTYVYSDNKWSW